LCTELGKHRRQTGVSRQSSIQVHDVIRHNRVYLSGHTTSNTQYQQVVSCTYYYINKILNIFDVSQMTMNDLYMTFYIHLLFTRNGSIKKEI